MDADVSKGARLKDGADRGAQGPNPQQDNSSREMSPHIDLPNLHNRECYALLFGIEALMTPENGPGTYLLPSYVWTDKIVWDYLSPTVKEMPQIVILNQMDCLIFKGCRTKKEGFTYSEATAYADAFHRETSNWIGHTVRMSLKDTRGNLRQSQDFISKQNVDRITAQ